MKRLFSFTLGMLLIAPFASAVEYKLPRGLLDQEITGTSVANGGPVVVTESALYFYNVNTQDLSKLADAPAGEKFNDVAVANGGPVMTTTQGLYFYSVAEKKMSKLASAPQGSEFQSLGIASGGPVVSSATTVYYFDSAKSTLSTLFTLKP